MRTSYKKPSERHEVVQMINRVSMRELRKDLRNANMQANSLGSGKSMVSWIKTTGKKIWPKDSMKQCEF